MELGPGTTFARFRIISEIGRGGMGVVWEARQEDLERRVAIKVIAPHLAADEEFRQRFKRESRIAASIEHAHVVPIYDAGEQDGALFMAMRYVEGVDLGQRIVDRGPLKLEEAVRLLEQVADGLDAVHEAGLIHRDVKPSNILLARGGGREQVYLTDFGLARDAAATTGFTRTGERFGTLDYMAPEQIEGGRLDARTDIYALGGVLHHALTGQVPFPKQGVAAKMNSHLNDPPPAPSSSASAVPAEIDPVVQRAMAKDPAERYQSAGDFGRALRAAVAGTANTEPERVVATGDAAPDAPTIRMDPPARAAPTRRIPPEPSKNRGRQLAIGLAVVVVLLAGGLAIAMTKKGGDGGRSLGGPQETADGSSSTGPTSDTSNAPSEPYSPANQGLYQVKVPTGWIQDESDQGSGGIATSIWHDPNERDRFIRIDSQTPAAAGGALRHAEGVRADTRNSSDYQEYSLGRATVGPWNMAKWEFFVDGLEKVDYFFDRCGASFAVLGASPPSSFDSWAPVFDRVAGSMRPACPVA